MPLVNLRMAHFQLLDSSLQACCVVQFQLALCSRHLWSLQKLHAMYCDVQEDWRASQREQLKLQERVAGLEGQVAQRQAELDTVRTQLEELDGKHKHLWQMHHTQHNVRACCDLLVLLLSGHNCSVSALRFRSFAAPGAQARPRLAPVIDALKIK